MLRKQNPNDRRTYEPPGIANPVLGIVVILSLFIPVAVWCGYNWFRASNLESYGVQAPGRVSSLRTGPQSRYGSPTVFYSFKVNGQIHEGSSTWGSSLDTLPSKGERVSITYDRENPDINSYHPQEDKNHAARIVGFDAAGTIGILIFLLMKMKRT